MFGAIAGVLIVGLLWSAIYWQGVKSEQQLARNGGPAKAALPAKDVPPAAPPVDTSLPPASTPGGVGLPLDLKQPSSPPEQKPPLPEVAAPSTPPPQTPPVTAPPMGAPGAESKTPAKRAEPPRKRVEPQRTAPPPVAPTQAPAPPPVVVASAPSWIDIALREGRTCLAAKQYACTIARAESVLKADPNHAGALALLKDGRSAQEQALGSDWKMR
jgi:hypothetical protein